MRKLDECQWVSGMWAWWRCGGLWWGGSKGFFWQLEMHDVHIQLQRQSVMVINTYLGHRGQMLISQQATMFSIKLEVKTPLFSKCHSYPDIQVKAFIPLLWKMLFSGRGYNILFHA